MAYNPQELEKKALKAIKTHKLMFIEHLVAYLPCCKRTFYDLKMHELPSIKKEIELTRISRKTKMLSNWIDSEVPSLQIAAMKMISEEHEAHRLNGSRQEIKHKGGVKSTLIKWKPAEDKK